MNKCGKSFLPECEYFTTSGCISPFNCPYKIEHESITTATSTPLNSNVIYTDETYKDNEIARLTAENERLKEEKTCRNTFEDENKGLFVCSKCKFNTINYYRLKLNKDDKYYHREYDIKYCPNCGAKVENQQ